VHYRDQYVDVCRSVIEASSRDYGSLSGSINLGASDKAQINWLFMVYLLNTIGAQTLAMRGSEKSAYGKLFEKLILGSLLCILGFEHVAYPPDKSTRVFWLSSTDGKRESDATLLLAPGKGVRFDIGFIGRGNTEISLDKVSRFEREISMGQSKYYMDTIILVDRVGPDSEIENIARDVGGTIIQMSAAYWPQQVARRLNDELGFQHALLTMSMSDIGPYLKKQLAKVPLEQFVPSASS